MKAQRYIWLPEKNDMKTVVIGHNYTPNTVAAMSYELAHHLATAGYRVIFISYRPRFTSPEIKKMGAGELVVTSWPTEKRPTGIRDFFWYAKLYLKYRPSVSLAHFGATNVITMATKILSFGRARTIAYYHTIYAAIDHKTAKNKLPPRLLRWRKRLFYALFCDKVVCPSVFGKEDLRKVFGFKKSVVVPNPMPDRYERVDSHVGNKLVVSFLGRLDYMKGIKELVDGYQAHFTEFPESPVAIRFAGSGSLKSWVEEVCASSRGRMTFHGNLPYEQVDEFIRESDFMIIPSLFDNLPTVGIEAFMNGVPVLLSENTGLTSYIVDGENGFVFEPVATEIEGLLKSLAKKAEGGESMREKARETYKAHFTISAYCQAMQAIIS